MSQENVEIVRRGFEVWNAGDMDSFRELCDPGVIWRGPEGWPEPGPYALRRATHCAGGVGGERGNDAWGQVERGPRVALLSAAVKTGGQPT